MGSARVAGTIVAVEGLSGAGKTRLLSAVSARTGAPVLREAWERIRPRISLEYSDLPALRRLESRLLAEDVRRFREACSLAEEHRTVLCDTDFLGPLTYLNGLAMGDDRITAIRISVARRLARALRAGRWGLADLYLYLDTPRTLALRRAGRSPRAHPKRWRVRHQSVGLHERAFWLGRFPALLPGRIHVLDGRERIERLTAAVRRILADPPGPIDPAAAERVLRAFLRPTPRRAKNS